MLLALRTAYQDFVLDFHIRRLASRSAATSPYRLAGGMFAAGCPAWESAPTTLAVWLLVVGWVLG